MTSLISRYAQKKVNPDFYGTITINMPAIGYDRHSTLGQEALVGDLIRCLCSEGNNCLRHDEPFIVVGYTDDELGDFDGYVVYDMNGQVTTSGALIKVLSKYNEAYG